MMRHFLVAVVYYILISPTSSYEPDRNGGDLNLKNETLLVNDNNLENNRVHNESMQFLKDIPARSNGNIDVRSAVQKSPSFDISKFISLPKSVNITSKFEQALSELNPSKELNYAQKDLFHKAEEIANITSVIWSKAPPAIKKEGKMISEPILPNDLYSNEAARTTTEKLAQPDMLLIAKLKEVEARKHEVNAAASLVLQYHTLAMHMFVIWTCMQMVWCPLVKMFI